MSASTSLPIRVMKNSHMHGPEKSFVVFQNETRLNGQQGQYLVATTSQNPGETNGNQTTGRVIIAKAHPPNQNAQINPNANNIAGPV